MRGCVLIADTENWAVEAITTAARSAGLEVVVARTGPEALELFLERAPLLAVLDCMLPVMAGPQLARQIRRTVGGEAVPIVLTQVLPDPDPEATCAKYRVSAVLAKPFASADVASCIAPFLIGDAVPERTENVDTTGWFELAATNLGALVLRQRRDRLTGQLRLYDYGILKALHFRDGDLVAVRSNAVADGWPAWAARDPALSPSRRQTAARLVDEAPFMDLDELQELGVIAADDVEACRRRRAIHIALAALSQTSGHGHWIEEGIADDDHCVCGFGLAAWALRRHAAGASLEEYMPAAGMRLCRAEDGPSLDLGAVENQVVALADDGCTVDEVLALGRLVSLDLNTPVALLVAAGVVREVSDEHPSGILPAGLPSTMFEDVASRGGLGPKSPAARILVSLWASCKTGIVEFIDGGVTSSLHFERGRIVFASSSRSERRLGEILLGMGAISAEEHHRALATQPHCPGRRIGALLVQSRALTLRDLYGGLVEQIRAIVADVVALDTGRFCFLPAAVEAEDGVDAGSAPHLVMRAYRRLELTPLRLALLPGDEQLLVPGWTTADIAAVLQPNATELAVLQGIGDGASTAALMRLALNREDAMRALLGFLTLGVVQPMTGDPTTIGDGELVQRALRVAAVGGLPADLPAAYRQLQVELEDVLRENDRLRKALRDARLQPV